MTTAVEASALDASERKIERGMKRFLEVGQELARIRDERLYKAVEGYRNFDDYCQKRWGFTRRRAGQLIEAATVAEKVGTTGSQSAIANERQARELAKVPESERADVWEEVFDEAESEGRKPTAADVKRVANTPKPGGVSSDDPPPPSPADEALAGRKPDKFRNGQERLPAKKIKELHASFGKFVRAADDCGCLADIKPQIDMIGAVIKEVGAL